MDSDSDLRIEVTNDDVRASKRAWIAASEGDAPQARVDLLEQGYLQLIKTQARQFVREFHAGRSTED